jgi:hypothetical protein
MMISYDYGHDHGYVRGDHGYEPFILFSSKIKIKQKNEFIKVH